MNARIVNLRTRRKQKARDEVRAAARRRATEFGRSKAERELTRAEAAIEAARLDGHELDDDAVKGEAFKVDAPDPTDDG